MHKFFYYFIKIDNRVICLRVMFILNRVIRVIFILSSISSSLEFESVNHTLMYENSDSKVFKDINILVKYVIIDHMIY